MTIQEDYVGRQRQAEAYRTSVGALGPSEEIECQTKGAQSAILPSGLQLNPGSARVKSR